MTITPAGRRLAVAVAAWAFAAPAGAADAPELRYLWKAGQTHVYAVTIEADFGDYSEILTGNPLFEVKAADQDTSKLTFRGGLTEKQQLKPDKKGILIGRPRAPFSPFSGVGGGGRVMELTVNPRGEVVTAKGSARLPYLLGDLAELMADPLPKGAEKTWKVSVPLNIVEGTGLPRSPLARQDDLTLIKATQETTYTIDAVTDTTVEITRKVELTTAETVGGKPKIEIAGKGTLTFDRKLGLFVKGEATHTITSREPTATTDTPVKISYRLLTDAEKATLAKSADGALLFPAEPLTEDLQKQALADLKSGDKLRLFKGLGLLQSKVPPKEDKEPGQLRVDIGQALEGVLSGPDKSMRFSAAKALVNWGTKENIPTLVKTVAGDDLLCRQFSMDALGKLKAEEAAEPICKRLAEGSDRYKAKAALEAIGPKAEPAVLKMADHTEWMVRNEVCNILAAIGTEKSLPTLTTLQSDKHVLVKNNAKKAAEAIEKRK